jgi:hypothetical protein
VSERILTYVCVCVCVCVYVCVCMCVCVYIYNIYEYVLRESTERPLSPKP